MEMNSEMQLLILSYQSKLIWEVVWVTSSEMTFLIAGRFGMDARTRCDVRSGREKEDARGGNELHIG